MTRTYKSISEAMSAVGAKEYRMTAGRWDTDNAGVLSSFDLTTRKFTPVATYMKRGDEFYIHDLPHESAAIEQKNLFT